MDNKYTIAGKFETGEAFRDWQNGNVHLYSRITDPVVEQLENALRTGSEAGVRAFSSGMAGISTLLIMLATRYDRIAVPSRMYGGSQTLISDILHPGQFAEIVALDLEQDGFPATLRDAVIFLESPANPTLETVDIAAWQEFAEARSCVLVVDNTVMTHVCQDPVRLGASYAVASCTKAISGQSDVLGGAVWVKDERELAALDHYRTYLGTIASASQAETLIVRQPNLKERVVRQSTAAHDVYRALERWGEFDRCIYPLATARGRAIAERQSGGLGGGLVTCITSDSLEQAREFIDQLDLVKIATSFGGNTTTVQIVNDIDYGEATNSSDFRKDPVLRFSIGDEGADRIVADVKEAWARVAGSAD